MSSYYTIIVIFIIFIVLSIVFLVRLASGDISCCNESIVHDSLCCFYKTAMRDENKTGIPCIRFFLPTYPESY